MITVRLIDSSIFQLLMGELLLKTQTTEEKKSLGRVERLKPIIIKYNVV